MPLCKINTKTPPLYGGGVLAREKSSNFFQIKPSRYDFSIIGKSFLNHLPGEYFEGKFGGFVFQGKQSLFRRFIGDKSPDIWPPDNL